MPLLVVVSRMLLHNPVCRMEQFEFVPVILLRDGLRVDRLLPEVALGVEELEESGVLGARAAAQALPGLVDHLDGLGELIYQGPKIIFN